MNNRVRIRCSADHRWWWELLTSDGHVVNATEPFESREACEADAKLQGCPVIGLSRTRSPT